MTSQLVVVSELCMHAAEPGKLFFDCRYFWTYNSGLQAQAVLQTQANLEEDSQILLDPNQLSSDGTVRAPESSISRLIYPIPTAGATCPIVA